MKSFKVENFFDSDFLEKVKKFVEEKSKLFNDETYHGELARYDIQVSLEDLNDEVTEKINKVMREKNILEEYRVASTEIVRYQIKDKTTPNLIRHKDKGMPWPFGVDIQIESTVDWPLVVEDVEIKFKDGDAVFLYGSDEEHWRNEYPSKSENDFCTIIFCWMIQKKYYDLMPKNMKTLLRDGKRNGIFFELEMQPSNKN